MGTITKTLLGVIVGLLVGGGAYVAAQGTDARPAGTVTTTSADVRGPCDEAEHANDPRCANPRTPKDRDDEAERGDNDGVNAPGHDVGDDRGRVNDDPADDRGEDDADRNRGSADSGHQNDDDASRVDDSGPDNAEDRGDDNGSDDSGSGSSGGDSGGSDRD